MNHLNEHGLKKLLEHLEQCSPGISKHITISDDCLMVENVVLVAYATISEDLPVKPIQANPSVKPPNIMQQVQSKLNQQNQNPMQQQQVDPMLQKELHNIEKGIKDLGKPTFGDKQQPHSGLSPAQTPQKSQPLTQPGIQNPMLNKQQPQAAKVNDKKVATNLIQAIGAQLVKAK